MHILKYCKKLDHKLPLWLGFTLLLLIVLRIPNFFEPYWYGDEAIYLTIGHAMNSGARLYAEIVDHKTPLIYFFARVPDQLSFRILLLSWMLVSTLAFSKFARFIFRSLLSVQTATLLFVLFTSLPWFEGNIPNGELFVMGFILCALTLLTHSKAVATFFHESANSSAKSDALWIVGAGMLLSGAVLTKVPAVFDVAAAGYLFVLYFLTQKKFTTASFWFAVRSVVWLVLGFCIPILLSIVYFVAIGAGNDYLQFGLLYNFHYSGTWVLNFASPILSFAYTFLGKAVILCAGIVGTLFFQKRISKTTLFLFSWTLFALFASLLSNRPYPHYFLQVLPPLILLVSSIFEWRKQPLVKNVSTLVLALTGFTLFMGVLITLHAGLYETQSYYTRFWKLATKQHSYTEYRNSFNSLMADNYAAAAYLRSSSDPKLFIWGTNPTLYALAEKQPVGKFTVSFHIKDLGLYTETMTAVTSYMPQYIVVMHDETTPLPGLDGLLQKNYTPFAYYDYFSVWRKSSRSTL